MTHETHSTPQLVLGLDGGGTSTLGRVFRLDPSPTAPSSSNQSLLTPLREAKTGSSNLNSSTVPAVEAELRSLLQTLSLKPSDISFLGMGLAGLSVPGALETMQEIFLRLGFDHLTPVIRGDHEAALRGAFDRDPGLLLISGTGAICVGQTPSEVAPTGSSHSQPLATARSGGYGYLIDDRGSGYAVGQRLLQEALLALDERRAPSPLTDAVIAALRQPELEGLQPGASELLKDQDETSALIARILELCYQQPFQKSRIAQFAPVLDLLLEQGDPDAVALAQDEARALVELARACARKLHLREAEIVLAGSLLIHSAPYRAIVLEELAAEEQRSGIHFRIAEARADAATGAALFALDEA